jgi:hypothetical protein
MARFISIRLSVPMCIFLGKCLINVRMSSLFLWDEPIVMLEFICSLFNDAVISSDSIASDDRMTNKQ